MNEFVCREGVFAKSTQKQVVATLSLLQRYRQLANQQPPVEDSDKAQKRLYGLILVAILRKAGLNLPLNHRGKVWRNWGCEEEIKMYRDCMAVRKRVNERIRVYQFETKEVRRRFSHLLSRYDED